MASVGTMSNVGFGTGLLSQNVIDQLKQAEEKAIINPYTTKMETNTNMQKDLTEIKNKLSSFQSSVSSLADATAFAKRKVSASVSENPPASLTANSGVALQSMNLKITQLAQKDVYQSKALANDSGIIDSNLSNAANLTFFSNGKEYTVTLDKNSTYNDLVDKINNASNGEIVAKMVNTGEKPDGYRLTITSKETGEDSKISFYPGKKDAQNKYSEDTNAKKIFKKLGWDLDDTNSNNIDTAKKKGYTLKDQANHIQTGQNSEFTLDGIKMTRSSNTITDLGVGITLTLNKTGDINFDIQQDSEGITKAMQDLADSYNDLVTNLNAATDYNADTGTAGLFQGVSEVNSIRSNILSTLFKSQAIEGNVKDDSGNDVKATVMLSLQDYGLTMTNAGSLNFDSSKFEEKMKDNPELAESFFSGITKYEDINYKSDLIKKDSLKTYLTTTGTSQNQNSSSTTGLTFKPDDFQIVYDDQVYDLSRNADGTDFVLTGKTEQEMLQNLVDHINSKNISGLKVKVEAYNQNNEEGFKLNFSGEGGSDFAIKGDSEFLKKLGLSATSITAKPIEGVGVFSQLKDTLKTITGTNGSLTKYDNSLTKEGKDLKTDKEEAQKKLNTRYDTLTAQFLQYDKIINKLQNQLKAVQSMISASTKSDS